MANKQQISFLLAFSALAMILHASQAMARNAEAKSDGAKDGSGLHKAYDLSLDYLNKATSMVKARNPNDAEEIKTILKEVANAFESCDYKDTESTTSKQQPSKAKPDGAKGTTYLDLINWMISIAQREKAKFFTLGNSKMAQDCIKSYDLSLDNLNKAAGMVKAGNPNNVKEINTILKEVANAFECCDYEDTKSTTSKQRPSKAKFDGAKGTTYLYLINWMIRIAQSEKAKVSTLGNSKMAQDCIKAYDLSLDYLNKAAGMVKEGNPNDVEEIKTILKEVVNIFQRCDYEDIESTTSKQRPSKAKYDGAKQANNN
ncbi:hypothetical protein PTKIN_Ptkin19aG0048700 [Pterospermum kingtungense]